MSRRDELAEVNPDMLFMTEPEYDRALLGVVRVKGQPTRALYSMKALVQVLGEEHGMSDEDALEHLEFNVLDAYLGEHTPAFLEDT